MIHTERTVRTLQAVAMTVGLAVFLWSTGLPTLFHFAEAASITNASDTLTNSAPSKSSVHTIAFTTDNGLAQGQTIVVTFPAGFDLSGLNLGDIGMTINGNATDTAASAAGGTWGVATGTPSAQEIQFTTPTDQGVASSSVIELTIGSESGTMITNPAATSSYQIDIGGSMQDSGSVMVAIIEGVTVSASVDTSLTFSVSGVAASSTVNGSATTTIATTTPTTLPFGTLKIDKSRTLAHDLAVTTNAKNGYSVTVSLSGPLQSSTGAIIDSFVDGTDTTLPQSWVGPSAQINDAKTYGHWGLTSSDGTTTRSNEFGSDQWVGIATSSPTIVMGNDGPSLGTNAGIGTARVGYQIQISALQEAGSDYNTTLRYIATPTF
jgi:hypothetical protein